MEREARVHLREFQQHEQFSTAIVTGPEWKTDELVLRLNPTAMISGHMQMKGRTGVRHAEVTLFLENHGGGMNRVRRLFVAASDDLGYFDFSGLMPGKYFLSVSATPWYAVNVASAQLSNNGSAAGVSPALDVAYPVTYYSSATEAADATPIVVAAGERPEVELQLNPVPALHILVRAKEDEQAGFQPPQLQKQEALDWVEPMQAGNVVPVEPGVYELVGVPPGKYSVRMNSGATGEMAVASEMNLSRDGEELDTSRGEPLSNLKITLKPEGGEAVPNEIVVLLQDQRHRFVGGARVDPSGMPPSKGWRRGNIRSIATCAGRRMR